MPNKQPKPELHKSKERFPNGTKFLSGAIRFYGEEVFQCGGEAHCAHPLPKKLKLQFSHDWPVVGLFNLKSY